GRALLEHIDLAKRCPPPRPRRTNGRPAAFASAILARPFAVRGPVLRARGCAILARKDSSAAIRCAKRRRWALAAPSAATPATRRSSRISLLPPDQSRRLTSSSLLKPARLWVQTLGHRLPRPRRNVSVASAVTSAGAAIPSVILARALSEPATV